VTGTAALAPATVTGVTDALHADHAHHAGDRHADDDRHADGGHHADDDHADGALHADAVRVLSSWPPPDAAASWVRDEMLALLGNGPRVLRRDGSPDHFTASTLVLDASLDRVLLCLHRRVQRWVQLGGHCEPTDTTLAQAALREATEESGIAGLHLLPEPIGVDIHPVHCSAGPSRHFDVRYVAVAPPGAQPAISAESAALDWFDRDDLPQPLAHATAILVAPALAAVTRTPIRPAP